MPWAIEVECVNGHAFEIHPPDGSADSIETLDLIAEDYEAQCQHAEYDSRGWVEATDVYWSRA